MKWKLNLGHWNAPTPKNMARLGSALFATSATVAVSAIVGEHATLALIIFAAGCIGKFLSEFFKDSEPGGQDNERGT